MTALDKIVFLLLILLGMSTAQPPIFRDVKVQCYKNSRDNTLTTYFSAELNGDDINYLFGLEMMAGSSPPMYMKSDDCTPTITTDGFIYLESMINMNDPTQSSNTCGYSEVMSTDPVPVLQGYGWRIALRRYEQNYIVYQDRDYTWECPIDSATDVWLTASLEVIADLEVPVEPTLPDISFYVISGNVDQPVTQCEVGDILRLQIKMELSGYLSIVKWGAFSIGTLVNYDNNFEGGDGLRSLTESDGCATDPNVLDLDYGFTLDSVVVTGSQRNLRYVARSGQFKCRKYQDQNMLYFQTTVDLCGGDLTPVAQRDPRCVDFCAHSTTTGRKRRQVEIEGNFTEVVTSIRVIEKENKEETPQKSEGVSMTVLIVVPTVVGVSLILLISVGVYCCLATRNGAIRKRRLDSRTSSERSIPVKF